MAKIEAVSVALGPNGDNLYVVDRKGRLWVKFMKGMGSETGAWHKVELPEEPAADTPEL